MYVSMKLNSTEKHRQAISDVAAGHYWPCHWYHDADVYRCAIGGIAQTKVAEIQAMLSTYTGVEEIVPSQAPYVLCARGARKQRSEVKVGDCTVGGRDIVLMAGPCSVESVEQLVTIGRHAKLAGAQVLRGGAFKPRTSPYDFQGTKAQGLVYLSQARAALGLKIVTEVLSEQTVDEVAEVSDILQIGARNMQNFALLSAVGRKKKPVLLKRGLCATLKEWLLAAEYVAAAGNLQIILCERGIRTFEPATRNTLDLSAVPVLRALTHLPVVVDPSHGTGRRDCIVPMAQAAVAAGADGLLIEAHPQPDLAWSDGAQSLDGPGIEQLGMALRRIAPAVDRSFG